MTENLEELPVASIEEPPTETIDVTEKKMLKQLVEKQHEQDKINRELIENQEKILEKLQSIEDEKSGRKRGREDSNNPIENPAKRVDSVVPKEEEEASDDSQNQNPIFEKTGKWFVLKHTFKNVSELEQGIRHYSEEEEHFGATWRMYICHTDDRLAFRTRCHNKTANGLWSIEADCEVKMMSKNGNPEIRKTCDLYEQKVIEEIKKPFYWGWKDYMKWEELENDYLMDDSLTFEVTFKIKNTTGIYKDNLRCFDDPECSDIVLVVQDKKFHVSKLFLAAHSTYFKAMFLGMFSDSNKSEIPLTGIDADDFQKYLEVLYGDYAIDEYTVEGILMISDMYDTKIAMTKCEEFLLKESKKTLKKKLELSVRYNLEELKKKCLSEIKTINEIRQVIPGDIKDLDPSLTTILLEKALNSNKATSRIRI